MVDWNNASEFDINKAVAVKLGYVLSNYLNDNYNHVFSKAKGYSTAIHRVPDYCNSWIDMGPIIERYEISLIRDTSTYEVWLAIGKAWFTVEGIESSLGEETHCIHKNPIRAAAVAFLKIP